MLLDISEYDRLEAAASAKLPNLAQAAFGPVTFAANNYPVRIADETELVRYIDVMHENAGDQYFVGNFSISLDEGRLLSGIGETVLVLSRERAGRPVRPWLAPLDALGMFRIVAAMSRALSRPNARVLEIGPGSGYLGALLLQAGFRHISVDNAQAFYLWQNRLFGRLAGNDFAELAMAGSLNDNLSWRSVHIPWWKFAALHEHNPFSVDFVVCDHALGEISLNGLRYILRRAQEMLTASGSSGMFLFRFTGARHVTNDSRLFLEFERAGFRTIFKRTFYALAPVGSPWDALAIGADAVTARNPFVRGFVKIRRAGLRGRFADLLCLDDVIPRFGNQTGVLVPRDAIPIRGTEAPPDYPFIAATGVKIPTDNPPSS